MRCADQDRRTVRILNCIARRTQLVECGHPRSSSRYSCGSGEATVVGGEQLACPRIHHGGILAVLQRAVLPRPRWRARRPPCGSAHDRAHRGEFRGVLHNVIFGAAASIQMAHRTLALSVRFIPVVEDEFERIRMAQKARGADTAGSLKRTLQVWSSAFIALFVGLFRHADNLALAMDARCYGASPERTTLPDSD